MTKANHIATKFSFQRWEKKAFGRFVDNLPISSLALVSLYGRFGAGLFECWIQ